MAVGKTVVSSRMIDLVTEKLGRRLYEVPVGFKWFVEGLHNGSLGFCGERARGHHSCASTARSGRLIRMAIIPALLCGGDHCTLPAAIPASYTVSLSASLAVLYSSALTHPPTPAEKRILANCRPSKSIARTWQARRLVTVLTRAPGNDASIGGIKVIAGNGWFAARPSGTEDIYKIYAESFRGTDHLQHILEQAETIVADALAAASKDNAGRMRSAG